MKKRILALALLISLAPASFALAFHEHVDIDGAATQISGYRAPTETENGYSGDEVCSVCGEVIKKGSSIPAVGQQRKKADEEKITPQPPVRTQAPENPVTPVPTAVPTKEPAPPPPKPTEAPVQTEAPSSDSVRPAATKKPSAEATPQPDLSGVHANTAFSGSSGSSGSSGGSAGGVSAGRGSSRSGGRFSATSPPSGGRNLDLYPIFSSRFPWRRLTMQPESGILLSLAGEPVWAAQQVPSSPLMTLQIPWN